MSMQTNMYEGLFGYHYLKRPLEVVPVLAAGMPEVSEDGLTWTIRLREGVRYAQHACFGRDGTRAVRAEDFVLALKRIADPHLACPLAYVFVGQRVLGLEEYRKLAQQRAPGDLGRYDLAIKGVEAVDAHTLRIRLTRPFPQFVYVLAMHQFAPVPREAVTHALAQRDDGAARAAFAAAELPGTGAYRLAEYAVGKRTVLVRNEEFRKETYPAAGAPGDKEAGLLADAGRTLPFINRIEYEYVERSKSIWQGFLDGRYASAGIPRERWGEVVGKDGQLATALRERGVRLVRYSLPVVYYIQFNMTDPVLGASTSLRQALCLAVDRKAYSEEIRQGRARPALNVLPRTLAACEQAGRGPYARFDREAARAKLQAARKELAAVGLLADGKIPQLSLHLAGTDEHGLKRAQFFAEQFAAVGVSVKPVFKDWPELQERIHKKQCQMWLMGWHLDYPDAQNALQLFYGANIAKGLNSCNYASTAFDKLYEAALPLPDGPKRRALYVRMVRQVSEDCPVLMLTEPQSCLVAHGWLRNVKPHPFAYGSTKHWRIVPAEGAGAPAGG